LGDVDSDSPSADENPAAFRLDRTSDPEVELAPRCEQRPVDDQPERAFVVVFAEQDDRAAEILVEQLWH
jgi:hypothetical protein